MKYLSCLTQKDFVNINQNGNPAECFLNERAFFIPYSSLDSYSLAMFINQNVKQRCSAISKVSITEKQRIVNVFYERLKDEQLGYNVNEHVEEVRRTFFGDQVGVRFEGLTYDAKVDPTPALTGCVYQCVHNMLNRFYGEIRRSGPVNNMVEQFLSRVPDVSFDEDLRKFQGDEQSITSYIGCFQKIRLMINDPTKKLLNGFDANLVETCSYLCNIFLPLFERIMLANHLLSRKSSTMSDIFAVVKDLENNLPPCFDFDVIFQRCFRNVYEELDYKFAMLLDPKYAYKKNYLSNVEWMEVARKLVEAIDPTRQDIIRKELDEYKELVVRHRKINNLHETIEWWHDIGRKLQTLRHTAQRFLSIFPQYVDGIPDRNIANCRLEADTVLQTDFFQGAGFNQIVFIANATYSTFSRPDVDVVKNIEELVFNSLTVRYCEHFAQRNLIWTPCHPAITQSSWNSVNQPSPAVIPKTLLSNDHNIDVTSVTPQKSPSGTNQPVDEKIDSEKDGEEQDVSVVKVEIDKSCSKNEDVDEEKETEEEILRRSMEIKKNGAKKHRYRSKVPINSPIKTNLSTSRVLTDKNGNAENEEEVEKVEATKAKRTYKKRKPTENPTTPRRSDRPKKPKNYFE